MLAVLCILDSRHCDLAVTELSLFTSDDCAGRKLPSLITDVAFHTDDSKEVFAKRPCLNGAPLVPDSEVQASEAFGKELQLRAQQLRSQ